MTEGVGERRREEEGEKMTKEFDGKDSGENEREWLSLSMYELEEWMW